MSILLSLSAYQNYRQFSQTRVQGSQVLKYLLQDPQFPRAFLHCLGEVQSSLQALPRNLRPLRYLNKMIREIKKTDLALLKRKGVHLLLDDLQLQLGKLHLHINETYFTAQDDPRIKPEQKPKATKKKAKKASANQNKVSLVAENRIG